MFEVVIVEATVDFSQQFSRWLQVDLGGTDVHMTPFSQNSRLSIRATEDRRVWMVAVAESQRAYDPLRR